MGKRFKEKVLRDPLYGNITINHPLILDLIDSIEFQRLRRIRQLGMCFSVFHGAEHSRFQHSIGAMWLMQRVLTYWRDNNLLKIKSETMLAACAAALLHDIGHGPFSHALENAFSLVDHETLGQGLVRYRLAPLFDRYNIDVEETIAIMAGTHPVPLYHELLSSQLDVDRMDYLQRDSLYTGAKYGLFDIDRIIYTIRPFTDSEGKLYCAVDHKGCEAVEGYLFCRYFMHWQVYLHKMVRSYETLLRVILRRAHYLYEHNPDILELPRNLRFLFTKAGPNRGVDQEFLENYIQIDDFDFYHTLKLWSQSPDAVMSDLSYRFLSRHPFKAFDEPEAQLVERIRKYVQKSMGDNWSWYFHSDTPRNLGYDIYEPGSSTAPIRILDTPPTSWTEISKACRTKAIEALSEPVKRSLLMIPHHCYEHIKSWLEKDRPYQSTMF
ncbi:MAG: HD domain-containing protein [bacterium]|nr:HD domain-containing protein [bacterium]